jgi:hypothetical protein
MTCYDTQTPTGALTSTPVLGHSAIQAGSRGPGTEKDKEKAQDRERTGSWHQGWVEHLRRSGSDCAWLFVHEVLVLLAFELSDHRTWLVSLTQALLILGIIVTSALDLRDLRCGRVAAGPPSE